MYFVHRVRIRDNETSTNLGKICYWGAGGGVPQSDTLATEKMLFSCDFSNKQLSIIVENVPVGT